MLCHSAVGACQIYVPGWVISIHYHDGYRGTKGDIVSFSLQLHNSCPSSSHPNLEKIIPQTRAADYTSGVYLRCRKMQPDFGVLLSFGTNRVRRRLPGVLQSCCEVRRVKTHRHNKGRVLARVSGTRFGRLHISAALLC